MASLTVLVLTDVTCSWCGRVMGNKFFNSSDPTYQEILKKGGLLISHGICPECRAGLIAEENIKHRVCV